ncbi:MAG: bifunctional nicotinamidase/pyrazinamidase [Paracoccaceae bacterium]
MDIDPRPTDALVVVDVQNDFCAGGALEVPGADGVVAPVNALMERFGLVVLTQDWHPAGHASFASQHPETAPFGRVDFPYGPQTVWPDHCVIGSRGAAFHPDLATDRAQLVIRKGFRREIDSYSAFFENDGRTATGLAGYLRERGARRVVLCGLATDFCVGWSGLDARRCGFEAVIVERASAGIDAEGSMAAIREALDRAGARLV